MAHDPSGQVKRLIVECKDYANTVGEETLNTLVGVLKQVDEAAGAVVTTKGFTGGARAVAADESIALIRLRHFGPEREKGNFVMAVNLTVTAFFPEFTGFDVTIGPSASELPEIIEVAITGADRLRYLDGTSAESLAELLESHTSPLEAGERVHQVEFPDERLIETASGQWLPISALAWTEILHPHSSTYRTEARGTPVLVLEQLDAEGNVDSGRLVVSEDLFAWDIDAAGRVHARGSLLPNGSTRLAE